MKNKDCYSILINYLFFAQKFIISISYIIKIIMQNKLKKVDEIFERYLSLKSNSDFAFVYQAVQALKILIFQNRNNNNVYISFNGGKDATVVLYLTVFAYLELKIPLNNINAIYFQQPRSFQQVDDFIEYTYKLINFNMIIAAKNFSQALTQLQKTKRIEYIIMGTRKTDPYCDKLEFFSASDVDKGYPKFMRVNPIIKWSYQNVWSFLLGYQIEYCKLYNEGYTYLGNQNNTIKNENLFDSTTGKYKRACQGSGDIQLLSRKSNKQSKC